MRWKTFSLGLAALAGMTPSLWAQAQPPAAPPPPTQVPPGATVNIQTAPAKKTCCELWQEKKKKCKEALCKSVLGQLLNNATGGLGAMTGGLIPPLCPTGPDSAALKEDLEKPATSAEGAAARIKKDEAEAKERRAAVRYLGTVDCRYWPEASDALAGSLRADKNECVRWEAAMALLRGCCCTKKTIAALTEAVSEAPKDGFPAECSDRVRAAAEAALELCLSHVPPPPEKIETVPPPGPIEKPEPLPKPPVEKPEQSGLAPGQLRLEALPNKDAGTDQKETGSKDKPASSGTSLNPKEAYQKQIEKMSLQEIIERARRTMTENQNTISSSSAPMMRSHSVSEIFASAGKTTVTPDRASGMASNSIMPAPQAVADISGNNPANVMSDMSATSVPDGPVMVRHTVSTPSPRTSNRSRRSVPSRRSTNKSMTISKRQEVVTENAVVSATPTSAVQPIEAVVYFEPMASEPAAKSIPALQTTAPATKAPELKVSAQVQVAQKTAPATKAAESPAAPATAGSLDQVMAILRVGSTTGERVWSAQNLANFDCRKNPQVVDALVKGAREDSDSVVRVACIRSLAKLGAKTSSVLTTLESLKSDRHSDVRSEASMALTKLSSSRKSPYSASK